MNILWNRFLKAAYRKEPVSSFILVAGAVDVALGGFSEHWLLMSLGLSAVGGALALRWWLIQQSQIRASQQMAQLYLPAHSSRPSLPMLSISRKASNNSAR